MRLDRQITLKIAAPLLKLRKRHHPGIPILMYHSISEPKGNHRHPYFETCTSPEVFAQHMKYLYENNYQVISLTEATGILQSLQLKTINYKLKTIKPVVLTFDDGFRDFYTTAAPILQHYGFTATGFLSTGFIDNSTRLNGHECMTWPQVRELEKYGVSFGSHTVSHPVLSQLGEKELLSEIAQSKERIESELGRRIDSFSYPYAFPEHDRAHYDALVNMLSLSGYTCGVSTRIGIASKEDDIFCLRRLPINSWDDELLLKAKIDGAYNWLYKWQIAYKRLKPSKSFLC